MTEEEKRAAAEAEAAAAEAAKKAEDDKKGEEDSKDDKKEPSYAELKGLVDDLRSKFVPKSELEKVTQELEKQKGTAAVVERIREAVTGEKDGEPSAEDKAKNAAFYKLLITDPAKAIRQVIAEDRAAREAENNEKAVERGFKIFAKKYPEYTKFEEDMKAELLANPGWFKQPDFLRRVFFDVLSVKDPKLLAQLVSESRGVEDEAGDFVFERTTQTDHGAEGSGKEVMNRLRSTAKSKSFFE